MKNNRIIIILLIILFIGFPVTAAQTNKKLYNENSFRNPFVKYVDEAGEVKEKKVVKEKQTTSSASKLKLENIISAIPFSLNGIIKSGNEKIALINLGSGSEFVEEDYKNNNYLITHIHDDFIVISSQGFRIRMEVGGEINEL